MISGIVTLVITMIVNGEDYERHEPMRSIEACWSRAAEVMEGIRSGEHEGIEIKQVGVGCVVDAGDPA